MHLSPLLKVVSDSEPNIRPKSTGQVTGIKGHSVKASMPAVSLGDICEIILRNEQKLRAEVVAFTADSCTLAPIGDLRGISPGDRVVRVGSECLTQIPSDPLGCILDASGKVLNKADELNAVTVPLFAHPPPPLERTMITQPLCTGITAIDALLTLGQGQRVGLFASAGLGKSTLMAMLARNSHCDACVIALIGERGREVQEFVADTLGEEGMKKSVIVAATSDESPMRRRMAGYLATATAEYLSHQGKNVLLLFDSLTRFARAVRDVGLSAGEMPVRQGYTSSVYSELPHLIERSGTNRLGSITSVYTVLTNTEMEIDPLADEIKSLLDGHILLSGSLASRGVRPAIDIVHSLSRLNERFHDAEYILKQTMARSLLARAMKDKDILLFGGQPDPELTLALEAEPKILAAITQPSDEFRTSEYSKSQLLGCISD